MDTLNFEGIEPDEEDGEWEYRFLKREIKKKTKQQKNQEVWDTVKDQIARTINAITEGQIKEIHEKMGIAYVPPKRIPEDETVIVARRKKRKMIDYDN